MAFATLRGAPDWSPYTYILAGSVLLWCLARLLHRARGTSLPLGPRRLPFIGGALVWPRSNEWQVLASWGERYGDVIYTHLFRQPIIILNSSAAAVDLLSKRGAIYSDRPTRTMHRLAGLLQNITGSPYDGRLRRLRALIIRTLGADTGVDKYAEMMQHEAHRMVRRLCEDADPGRVQAHIRQSASSIILSMTYGYQVQQSPDPFIDIADNAQKVISKLGSTIYLVDALPFLRFLPEWFPGTGFHSVAREAAQKMAAYRNVPFDYVKQQLKAGTARPSFVAEHLENGCRTEEDEELIKVAAAGMYGGGTDTTISTTYTFFLAMVLHPEIQKRAQAEIDANVGSDRLPTLADREHLPYVRALVQEVFRWRPSVPLGGPHVLRQEDLYRDMLLPKGSVIIPNVWNILHDPERYTSPMVFDPARFLAEDGHVPEEDPAEFAFGFGRRVCPGMKLAQASIFLSVALSLAVSDIRPTKDDEDRPIIPNIEYTSGLVSHPKTFPCAITPRSERAKGLVMLSDL